MGRLKLKNQKVPEIDMGHPTFGIHVSGKGIKTTEARMVIIPESEYKELKDKVYDLKKIKQALKKA